MKLVRHRQETQPFPKLLTKLHTSLENLMPTQDYTNIIHTLGKRISPAAKLYPTHSSFSKATNFPQSQRRARIGTRGALLACLQDYWKKKGKAWNCAALYCRHGNAREIWMLTKWVNKYLPCCCCCRCCCMYVLAVSVFAGASGNNIHRVGKVYYKRFSIIFTSDRFMYMHSLRAVLRCDCWMKLIFFVAASV